MDESLRKILLRKSAYMSWRICPKKYEHNFTDGHVFRNQKSAVELTFGSLFHEGGKLFFQNVRQDELLKCKTKEEALKVFEPFVINQKVVKPWFENFKRFEAYRWELCVQQYKDPMRYWLPVVPELELISDKYGLMMHIDRINRVEEHALMNVEYKSSKTWYISKLREETMFYNIGINSSGAFDDPCLFIGAYNPQLDKAFMERISKRLINRVFKLIVKCKQSIRDKDFPYKPNNILCRYCTRVGLCVEENFGEKEV